MIHNKLEFFNVSEIEQLEGRPGIRLQRFPKAVREKLGWGFSSFGRYVAQLTTGCEIRFVTEGDAVDVSLTAADCDGEVLVYKGDFLHSRHRLEKGVLTALRLTDPWPMKRVRAEVLNAGRFSHRVWRVLFCHDFICEFNGIDSYGYRVRPPQTDEVPRLKWLAYGSSITHGANALIHSNSYIMQAARRLGVDVLDKGMGGSCLCEREMGDYLAALEEWDFATLEMGVNMRGMSLQQFTEAAGYVFNTIRRQNPQKHIFLITPYPNYADYLEDANDPEAVADREFGKVIRQIWEQNQDGYTHLLEGSDILTDLSFLSSDMIHPSEYGHIRMGEKLAVLLEQSLNLQP